MLTNDNPEKSNKVRTAEGRLGTSYIAMVCKS